MIFSSSLESSDCITVYPAASLRLKAGSVDPTAQEEGGDAVENPETPAVEETEKQVENQEEGVFDRPTLCGMKLRLCLFIWSGFILSSALLHLIGAAIYPGTASKITTVIVGLIVGGFAGALIFIAYKKKEEPFKIIVFATYVMMGVIAVAMIVLLITVWTASVDKEVTKLAMKNKPYNVSKENYAEVKKDEDKDVKAYVDQNKELTSKKKTATGYLIVVSLLNIGAVVPIWLLIRRAMN